MPIYEYECAKCGKTIEIIQKFSDKEVRKHPGCGGALTKQISASAFHLKGTGWYATDYAKKPSASTDSKDTPSNGDKEKKSDKTEKPAAKAETKESSPKPGAKKD